MGKSFDLKIIFLRMASISFQNPNSFDLNSSKDFNLNTQNRPPDPCNEGGKWEEVCSRKGKHKINDGKPMMMTITNLLLINLPNPTKLLLVQNMLVLTNRILMGLDPKGQETNKRWKEVLKLVVSV